VRSGENHIPYPMIKRKLNTYLGMSRTEFRGLIVLAWLVIIVIAAPFGWQWLRPDTEDNIDLEETEQAIAKLERRVVRKSFPLRRKYSAVNKHNRLFFFDPNQVDMDEWKALGLSEKQAAAILKYRGKGGHFNKPEDLQKMYTISPRTYGRLLPYIRIEQRVTDTGFRQGNFNNTKHPAVFPVIELNGADSAGLCLIKGVGPVFASRIIRYRNQLGGFYNTIQLMEIFGLDSLKYRQILTQVTVDSSAVRKININEATFEMLKGHPYLRYKQINALLQFKKQHGNYHNIADLSQVLLLSAADIARLAPYLTY